MNKKEQKEKSQKPAKLLTLDVETRGQLGGIFLSGLYNGKTVLKSTNINDILTHLQELGQQYEVHVYVHFLDFDLSKFLKELFNLEQINFDDCIFVKNRVVRFSTENIIFHDSYKLLPHSLEKLCEDFGLSSEVAKLSLDEYMYNNGYVDKDHFFQTVPADDEFLNMYLDNDCISLYEIINETIRISGLTFRDFVSCPTVASLAKKVYEKQFPEDYKKATSTRTYNMGDHGKYVETMIRGGYYGGRVEVYKPFGEKIYHYDVTSLYPHVMKEKFFPIGEPKMYNRMDKIKPETVYKQFKRTGRGAGFAYCYVNVPDDLYLPILPYKALGKTFFPTGKLYGVWTFHELQLAEENGCTVEAIDEVYYFRHVAKIFDNYVKHFEDMKNNSHGSKRAFAKLMSNSLSGKFGAKREVSSMFNEDKAEKLEGQGIKYIKCSYNRFETEQKYLLATTRLNSKYIQPHLSAYITSYARIFLFKQLKEQKEKGDLYYCDTDAIVCEAKMKDYKVHQQQYGKWKLEGYVNKGVYPQAKFYAEEGYFWNEKTQMYEYGENVKAKGVPKEHIEKMNYEDVENMCIQLMNGDRDIKLYSDVDRASLGRVLKANLSVDAVSLSEKVMKLRSIQKRVVNYQLNDSIPHHFLKYGDRFPVQYEPDEIHLKMMDMEHDQDNDETLFDDWEGVANL